jgi:cysteine desulfurase
MSAPAESVYLDYNGSTPVDAQVREAFLAALDGPIGNASAAHAAGLAAREAIDAARRSIAAGIGARPDEVWFTSGGTESNNWAVLECAAAGPAPVHLVVSSIEHKSVLQSARRAEERGAEVTFVDPRPSGRVDAGDIERALRPNTRLVALMLANNETGILQPVSEVGALCRGRGAHLLCDAVAAIGKVPVDVGALRCDFLSLSAHKLYAPKGVGVLYIRAGVPLPPFVVGCGQQCGLRGGTENTAGVAALGAAFERLAAGAFDSRAVERVRDLLWKKLRELRPDVQLNGDGPRLPNTLSVAFPGVDAAELQARLAQLGVSVSAGAAASNGAVSHVLAAMNVPESLARGTLRFSLGAGVDARTIDRALRALALALAPRAAPAASEHPATQPAIAP